MRVFIYLHILVMFGAVAMSFGVQLVSMVAARSGSLATLRGALGAVRPIARFIGPAFGLGILLGIVAIFTNDYDPLKPWLIIAYVLTVAALVWANVWTAPRMGALGAAAMQSPEGAPFSSDLQAAISRNFGLVAFVDTLLIAALIADMVLKPFS